MEWTVLPSEQAENTANWLRPLSALTFNVRSILKLERRTTLDNCLQLENFEN